MGCTLCAVFRRQKGDSDYVLLLGNAWILVVFLDRSLDIVLFLPDAGEADLLPANAISSANPAKEICRWGDHE